MMMSGGFRPGRREERMDASVDLREEESELYGSLPFVFGMGRRGRGRERRTMGRRVCTQKPRHGMDGRKKS